MCVYVSYYLHSVSEYLSQFISVNNESKFKNNVQLTVAEQLKKLTKGDNTIN